MDPTPLLAFAFGCCGSLAVEVVLFLRAIGPRGSIAARCRSKLFWLARIVLALCSGMIALSYYKPEIPFYLYVHLGAATPAILTRAASNEDESETG